MTCTASGRQCTYDRPPSLSPGEDLKVVQWKLPSSSPQKSPAVTNWPSKDLSFLQYFQEVCCAQLMGSFDDAFWIRTICQIAENTAAVRHAIIAVSTSWKQFEVSFESGESANLDSEKGLRHYLSAVSHVQALSRNHQCLPMHDILVCNILFFCLELCQQDYESALHQMSSFLDIFCGWIRDFRGMMQSDSHLGEVEQNLVKVFRRMLAQAMLFIDTHYIVPRVFEPEASIASCTIPRDFASAEEARDCLQNVMSAMIHQSITRRMIEHNLVGSDQEISRPMFRFGFHELEQFSLVFNRFCEQSTISDRKGEIQRAAIKAQFLSVRILAAVSMSNQSEWAFDQHLSTFKTIVEECSKVARLLSENAAGVFSFDMEMLSPLYFVAGRCRDSRIRREALGLLRGCHRQEGPWNGPMIAAVVQYVIDFEEVQLSSGIHSAATDVKCRLTLTDAIINSRRRVVEVTFATRHEDSQDIAVQIETIAY